MVHSIIPCGGKGLRLGNNTPKQYLPLLSIPIVVHTMLKFQNVLEVSQIHIAAEEQYHEHFWEWKEQYGISKLTTVINGGSERQLSIYELLQHLSFAENDIILVHDAVRPFVSTTLIQRVISDTYAHHAVIPTIPISDTIKRKDPENLVVETIDRTQLVSVQTPQGFTASILLEAYRNAVVTNFLGTDDSSLVEKIAIPVYCTEGEQTNMKITTKEDIQKAEFILSSTT
jgi:2-C-methyl-D-erythritol 4-phosphate cytidylyltransferase